MGWLLFIVVFILAASVVVGGCTLYMESKQSRKKPAQAEWDKFKAEHPELYTPRKVITASEYRSNLGEPARGHISDTLASSEYRSTSDTRRPAYSSPAQIAQYTINNGELEPRSSAHAAFTTFDLDTMLQEFYSDRDSPMVDKHFLMMHIVKEAYKRRRDDPRMAEICKEIGWQHVNTFSKIKAPLKRSMGLLPHVTTFEHLATVLAEEGSYDDAIKVCDMALKFGLDDWTKTGYQGRIERIKKKKTMAVS